MVWFNGGVVNILWDVFINIVYVVMDIIGFLLMGYGWEMVE